MGYTVEKISGNQVKINFEIPSVEFDEALQKAYLKMRSKVQVPGFRKGRAPRKLIEQMYGEGVFYDDAFEFVFPSNYEKAVKENDITPVDTPEVDEVKQMGAGKDMIFSVKVFVKPEITLGDYKGVKAVKYVHNVTEEEISARIDRDVQKETTTQEVTRPVQTGDTVNLNYMGTVDGVAFQGGTADNQTLEIGSNTFIPGFEDQMIGMNVGEEKDLTVKFPEEYHAEELKGKDAIFHVKVNKIEEKVKPELDDDFAADVSEFSTFAEYKENIQKQLNEEALKNADVEVENNIVQQVVDAADCDIPTRMIDDEIDLMKREMKMRMAYQGIRYEDYIQYTGQTDEQVSEMYRPEAQNRVKMQLVLEQLVKTEDITVSDEDVETAIADEAKRANREVEAFKNTLNDRQLEYLRENAKIRKLVDLMVSSAKIEEKDDSERIDLNQTVEAVKEAAEKIEENTDEE